MDHIWRNMDFLGLVANPASKQQVKALISTSTDEQLNIISELALNLLQERVKLSKYYKSKLIQEASFIRELANKQIGSKKRRSITLDHINTTSLILRACLKHIRDG